MQIFKKYRIHPELLIVAFQNHFEVWQICQSSMHLKNDLEFAQRKESFSTLIDLPFRTHLLTSNEKKRIEAEYVTLHPNAISFLYINKGCRSMVPPAT